MVSLFGAASETCLEIADGAPYARAFAAAVQGLPHLRGAGHQHGARDLVGFETRGVEGQPQKSSMRRMTRSGLPPALRIAHRPRVAEASKNMAARVCSAVSKWRASTRCVASSPRVRREKKATPRFFLLLCGAGGLKRDGVGCHNRLPHPHWHVASSVGRAATSSPIAGDREVRRARRLKPAAAHCITFADVTSRRRG